MIRRRTVAVLLATAVPVVAWSAADFVYDDPQTGYYSIHPMSFAPDGGEPAGGYFTSWNRGRLIPDSSTQQCMNAGVNLPDDAVVQEVQVWFSANSTSVPLYATLVRTELDSGRGTRLVEDDFTDGSGNRVSRTRSVDDAVARINNAQYQYGFGVCVRGQTIFNGARIKYTYRKAGD